MKRPKLLIIVLFQNLGSNRPYYANSPAPPLPGILLAALTPDYVEVEVVHEMVRPIPFDTDSDFIALSFMDHCAPHAYEVAAAFQARGKPVIAGGKYASTFPQEVIPHFDATVIGEAHPIWAEVVADLVAGRLKKQYVAPASPPLTHLPPPRYDLVEPQFAVPVVTEATRGCIYRCSFCQLTIQNEPFRKRPIPDVIADLQAAAQLPFHKRLMAMIYDNNLGSDMKYAKALLREVARLNFWGLGVQFSFDCLYDDEFIDVLAQARCRMAFIGLESLNEPSLAGVRKNHNRVAEYQEMFLKLRQRGIMTFTGMILALDNDTPEYYASLPAKLRQVDPSTVLFSLAIPIPGTPFHRAVESSGRLLDRDLSHYEGDHLVFQPGHVSADQVFAAYVALNRSFYAWPAILGRGWRLLAARGLHGNPLRWVVDTAILSVMFLKLSLFQRGHAAEKVYPFASSRARNAAASRNPRTSALGVPRQSAPKETGSKSANGKERTFGLKASLGMSRNSPMP